MFLVYLSIGLYFLVFVLSLLSYLLGSLKRLTTFLMMLAFLVYITYVIRLGIEVKSFPFADVYGFYSLLGNGMLFFLTLLSLKLDYIRRFLALFAMLGVLWTLLLIPAEPSPYRSTLYSLHVTFALFSYAFALFGGFSSLLRLFLESKLKHKTLQSFFLPLNILRSAERFSIGMSFIFFTLTLVFGSLWSRSFFGKHWINDPKLIYVLFLWVYYALLVHLNLLRRIKPRSFSYGAITGMVLSILGLLFVRHEL